MTNAGKIEEAIAEHTPLPWKVVPAPKGYVLIVDETDRKNIAQISTNSRTEAENEANAALIVRAVNAHEGLVKALEEIRDISLDPNARATAHAALKQSEDQP